MEGVSTVEVIREGNSSIVRCSSLHLTSFAVLVNVAGVDVWTLLCCKLWLSVFPFSLAVNWPSSSEHCILHRCVHLSHLPLVDNHILLIIWVRMALFFHFRL